MNWILGLAIALTRSWAATYTRGLPPDVRAGRREEIDCDLWYQQRLADLEREPVMGTAMEVLARWLAGIPSDITWRAWTLSELRAERKNGATEMISVQNNRWKYILSVLVVSIVALLAMWAYSTSLDSWGEVGSIVFGVGGPLLMLVVAFGFLALLVDLAMRLRASRRQSGQ